MILTSVAAARSIWLFDINDLNPRGRYIYDQMFQWLIERYRFAKAPAHAHDQIDNAWHFLDGVFVNRDGTPVTVTLKVFNDGLVSETRSSTDDSDAFLQNVLAAAVEELGVTFSTSMVHRKIYGSELNVVSDKLALNPRVREFVSTLSEMAGARCEPTSLVCGGEPPSQPQFRFERKAGVPFSRNQYWSFAALPTANHLVLLERLEELFTA